MAASTPAQLGAGVDAVHFVLVALRQTRGIEPVRDGEPDEIGQIVLALGVGVADARQEAPTAVSAAAKRHEAGIAQIDRALGCARVALLADGDERPAHRPSRSRP